MRLTVADAARALGVGRSRVRMLDALLAPRRDEAGIRVYTGDSIAAAIEARAAAAVRLSRERAARARTLAGRPGGAFRREVAGGR